MTATTKKKNDTLLPYPNISDSFNKFNFGFVKIFPLYFHELNASKQTKKNVSWGKKVRIAHRTINVKKKKKMHNVR